MQPHSEDNEIKYYILWQAVPWRALFGWPDYGASSELILLLITVDHTSPISNKVVVAGDNYVNQGNG